MIDFPGLPAAIAAAGPEGLSLVSLIKSPTSRAAVGILAERSALGFSELESAGTLEMYRCEDRGATLPKVPSPFALFCVDTQRLTSEAEAQGLCENLMALLRHHDLHTRPAIALLNGDGRLLTSILPLLSTSFLPLTPAELVGVLLAHPPRDALYRKLRVRTPISLLNPYVYRGPIGRGLFFGRHDQLKKLSQLQTSYALIGPRAIGKTSLMNLAFESLLRDGCLAIRVVYSESMGDYDLSYQILDAFIREHGADNKLLTKVSPQRVQRLIQDYVMRSSPRKVAVLIDEADLLADRCPQLAGVFRQSHNSGWAKFVFVGFRKLRKAVNDQTKLSLTNFLTELPLSGLSLEECGALVVEPMLSLGIQFENLEDVVRTIHHESGGSPSRIQLLCHFIVERLSGQRHRLVGRQQALQAIHDPEVRKFLNEWFFESTVPLSRWLAALATLRLPCPEERLVDYAVDNFYEFTGWEVKSDIQDLVTANILDYQADGNLDFTFPAMKEIARPSGSSAETMAELRRMARESRQKKV
ncbi:MAG: ATP-binding protein [Verrucomicrobiales bacterium]|nr:ATP-binding protein [Verrucomicrobiales bacterium]